MQDRDPNAPSDDAPPNPATPPKPPKPIVIERYKFKQDIVGYLTQPLARLYLLDLASKKTDSLTAESLEAASPNWSPDGQSIAFLGKEGKDADRYDTWNVYVMEARAGATPRQVTHYDGVRASASLARPAWSPDGTRLVYLQSSGAKDNAYNMTRLAIVPVAGGDLRILAGTLDRGVSAPRFTADGSSILFLVVDDRSEYLARVPASGGEVERLVKGPGAVSAVAQGVDGRPVVLAASDAAPVEVHALENGVLRPLTHHNDALLGELKLGSTEEFNCKAKDGNEVHGLLVKPPDFEPGRKYPRCCASTADPTGRTRTPSVLSGRSSAPTATLW